MRYRFITSMSEAGYREYGKNFLDSWPLPITVYSEDALPVPYVDLNLDDELTAFLETAPEGDDYRFQAGKFAKKVFAVTGEQESSDWRIWIDADVVVDGPITEEFLQTVCPEDKVGSYLGRKDWHHSECGWVAYNMRYAKAFLRDFREIYTSGEIYDHLEWHDSYIFDRVMEKHGKSAWKNLSEGVPGMHVWDETPLGSVMRHLKGPLRKAGKTANVPKSYWSEKEREI